MTERISFIQRNPVDRRVNLPPSSDESDLGEFWLAVRRQIWLVMFFALAGLVLGGFHYVTSPKQYYASATILMNSQQSALEQEISATLPLLLNETGMQNEIEILGSLQLATTVVRALDLQSNENFLSPRSSLLGRLKSNATGLVRSLVPTNSEPGSGAPLTPEQAAERRILDTAAILRARTTFSRVGRSFTVEIGYLAQDPALAVAIANEYATAYLADGTQANLESSERKAAWMRDRIEELRQAAQAAASEAFRFQIENGASDRQGLLERDQRATSLNDLFLTIQSRYEQIALEGSFPITNGRVLSAAITPKQPAKPKAWQLLGIGLVIGTILGLGMAVLREGRETGFRTGDDVRKLTGLPFLGYLPTISARSLRRRSHAVQMPISQPAEIAFASLRHASAGSSDAPFVIAGSASKPTATHEQDPLGAVRPELFVSSFAPGAEFVSALRNIFASVDLGFEDSAARVVAVGAIAAGEGATTVAANLANLAAQSGYRTLLIDSDFAQSDLSHRLGADACPGTLGVIDGTISLADAIVGLPHTGLDFLPTGASTRRDEAWSPHYAANLADVITSVRSSYNYVFIDLPPMGLCPEAKTLARSLDRIALVTRWGDTSRRAVQTYLDQEPEIRRRTVGTILNRTNLHRLPRYGVPRAHRRAFSAPV